GLSDANKATLQSLALTSTQVYTFEPIEGEKNAFNFKNNGGTYIGEATANAYDIIGHAEANENTKFIIELYDIDTDGVSWYLIYCVKRGGYVASDNTGEGDGIYCDKARLTTGLWAFTEIDESEVVTTALEMAIANAQAAFDGKTIGDGPNEYPQSAVDALNAAIAVAQAALEAKANQAAINQATDDLNSAISRFLNSKIVFKADPTKQYYFMQEASSLILTVENNVATINNPQGLDAQKFRLIPVEEGSTSAYNLQLANGTDYLIRKGGWDTGVGTDPTVDVAKWRFEIADLENGYYLLRKYETGGYFATDSNTPGSWVYCNKGNSANGRWKIIEVIEGQALTEALDATIANAQALLAGAVVGEEPYNYPQEAVDALTAALNAANAADRSSQEAVNDATTILQDAISDFKAAQIKPWFRAEAGVKYRFSTAKYETKYMTNIDGSAKTTAAYTAGEAGQQWTLTEVDSKSHAFVLYNGENVLDYDGNVVDPSSLEEMPKWRTIYTNTSNNIEYFALVQDADPTQVVAFSSGNTWAVQTLSTTNNAHQGRFMRVDPVNDANLGALEIAIATAQAALNGVDRGPAIGQYSDAKCAAFQALIDQAKTYY
ncbi:MAG: FIVAR domain-containing protein, partial [Muribaculaceae bacterium]|nr:FIVAR domain-containing protein [Muribaculaceae bacterium]